MLTNLIIFIAFSICFSGSKTLLYVLCTGFIEGFSDPNLGSPKWFVGLSRVPLAGPRYGLSWGRLGFQGRTGVPEPGRSIDGRCGGRREQVEISGSTQSLVVRDA